MSHWQHAPDLAGRRVRLEPLQAAPVEGWGAAAADGEWWNRWYTSVPRPGAMAVTYSIIDREWPAVKRLLQAKMEAAGRG